MSVSLRTVTADSPHDAHTRSAPLQVCAAAIGLLSILWQGSQPAAATESTAESQVSFQSQVLPILKRNCLKCHGVSKREGQLQLHTAVRIWKGGESGSAVVAANPSQSLLWAQVEQNQMPPEKPLSEQEKRILHDWIAQGAEGLPKSDSEAELMRQDEHWAFTRLQAVEPPEVKASESCRTPLDHFVQSELEKAGLHLSSESDRRTLIRRICFTLTGLPPTPEEIDGFLADQSADAVESLADHYLASPEYGVRWGRHWLDAAGYADSNGYFNADSDRPLAYRYRDYVVRSINADKPFDQFVREQLAGDELAGFNSEQHRRQSRRRGCCAFGLSGSVIDPCRQYRG